MDDHYEDYEMGRDLFDRGEYDRSIGYLKASIEKRPHYKTFELIGSCYYEMRQTVDALTYFLAAAAMHPSSSKSCYLAASCLVEKQSYEVAETLLKQAIATQPNYKRAHDLLIQVKGQGEEKVSGTVLTDD